MKIGTWNVDGKWDERGFRHRDLLLDQHCDVWLLTEVNPKVQLDGYYRRLSSNVMICGQHWAAVLSRDPFCPLTDPHPASAAVRIEGITYCLSVLPWGTCGTEPPWIQGKLHEKTTNTLTILQTALLPQDLVWGGDWNQNLKGGWENVGSGEGRKRLKEAIESLNLKVPTADFELMYQMDSGHTVGLISHTIDHIAVPAIWNVRDARQVVAQGLSKHDAYVVEVDEPPSRKLRVRISENAYFRWVKEGHPHGHDWRHWFDAEKDLCES